MIKALFTCAAVTASALLSNPALAQGKDGVPLMKPPLAATPAATPSATPSKPAAPANAARPAEGGVRTLSWDALVPPGWDPFKEFKDLNFQSLDDGDPRATAMMKKMREAWDNAPVNTALAGQVVRIPGFVVPLEESKDGLKEFLLVPYFGACIHSPPPPANQIVHVLPRTPAKGLRSMDAVWISGTLTTGRTDSYMGAASYRIEAVSVTPYTEGSR